MGGRVKTELEELKEFILWAKTQGIATLNYKGCVVTFFPTLPEGFDIESLKVQEAQRKEEQAENDLYWSAQ